MRCLAEGVALLALSAAVATAAVVRQHDAEAPEPVLMQHGFKISPTLRPASDRHFFKSDYPRDAIPEARHKLGFGYPYPVIQDGGEYDKDYVKDENADDGEWKAQEVYDRLRVKVEKEKKEAEETRLEEQKYKKAVDAANRKEADAENKAKEAEMAADQAKAQREKASAEVDDLAGKEGGDQMGGKIGKQIGKVNKEIADVEECQKQLKREQDKLKKLMAEKEARRKAVEAEQNKAGGARDEAQVAYEAAKKAEYDQMDKDLLKKIQDEKAAYDRAVSEFSMSEAEMKKTEAALDKAAARLRAVRHKADPSGGVSYVPPQKAAAAPRGAAAARVAVLAAMSAAVAAIVL